MRAYLRYDLSIGHLVLHLDRMDPPAELRRRHPLMEFDLGLARANSSKLSKLRTTAITAS